MEKKKGGDLICMRPDSIIEARFKLTKKQNDIMDMVFSNIKDDEKLEYEIDISKYSKLYNLQDKSDVYGELKKAAKTFEGKGFSITQKISEKKEHRIYFSWFSSIEYIDGEGKIKFELGQKLKTILLEVKRAAFYNIQYTLNLNCIYSKRLYYYLKLYEDTGKRFDVIDVLRDKLECPESYKKYSNFRRFVLEPAYEEINGNSDISFEYEEIKTKNKVTAIKFNIKTNKVNKPKALDEVSATLEAPKETNIEIGTSEVLKILKAYKIDPLDAREIFNNADGDINYIEKVYEYSKTQNVKNLIGFMKEMVKPRKLNINTKVPKPSTFTDYNQRSYDFDDLEKKLLGYGELTENEKEVLEVNDLTDEEKELLGWDKEKDENTGEEFEQGKFL